MTLSLKSSTGRTSAVMFAVILVVFHVAHAVRTTTKAHRQSLQEFAPRDIDLEKLANLLEELGAIKDRLEVEVLKIFESRQANAHRLIEEQTDSHGPGEYLMKRGDPLGLGGRFGK